MQATELKGRQKIGLPQTRVKQSFGTVQVFYADFLDEKHSYIISNGVAEFGIAGNVAGFGIARNVAGFRIADDVAGFGIADNFEDIAHDDERILTNNSAPARRVRRGGS